MLLLLSVAGRFAAEMVYDNGWQLAIGAGFPRIGETVGREYFRLFHITS